MPAEEREARLSPADRERMAASARRAQLRRERQGRRRRAGDPVLFSAAIESLVDARGWVADVKVAGVLARWEAMVGPQVAAHSRPESLRDGQLVVVAESTAWATQLRLLAPALLRRLGAELGPGVVHRLRVHGPSGPPRQPGQWRVAGGRGERDTYG